MRAKNKERTVGQTVPHEQIRIADDGEILVKGDNVSPGYVKDEPATQDAYQDGWLLTGDLGVFDADGYLKNTGRKKEIIITAGGNHIAPNNIESAIKRHPLINEAVVIGDQQKYLTVLLTLEPEGLEEWSQKHGVPKDQAHTSTSLHDHSPKHIDDINPSFARVEQIKKFTVLPKNFSVEEGELTPSLKIKRRIIVQQFEEEIRRMYD